MFKLCQYAPNSAASSLILIKISLMAMVDLNHLIELGKMVGADPKFLFLRRLNSHSFSISLCKVLSSDRSLGLNNGSKAVVLRL